MPTLEAVRRDALALSDEDRQFLAVDLALSFEKEPGYDEFWAAEIKRRLELPHDDDMEWDEAEAEIFGDLDQS